MDRRWDGEMVSELDCELDGCLAELGKRAKVSLGGVLRGWETCAKLGTGGGNGFPVVTGKSRGGWNKFPAGNLTNSSL